MNIAKKLRPQFAALYCAATIIGLTIAIPVWAGPPVKLNTQQASDRGFGTWAGVWRLAPDGNRVVFESNWYTHYSSQGYPLYDAKALYSVPVGGGTPIKLTPTTAGKFPGSAGDFIVGSDSGHVFYKVYQDGTNEKVYSVPISGGTTPVALTPGDLGGLYSSFTLTPDGSRLVYGAYHETASPQDGLYSNPSTGGAAVLLESYGFDIFSITPDGTRVVYLPTGINATPDLYSIPITGGSRVKLNDSNGDVSGYWLTPDGSRVVYRTRTSATNFYGVPTVGGTPRNLTGTLQPATNGSTIDLAISSDGMQIIYTANHQNGVFDGILDLYSSGLAGGEPVKLDADPSVSVAVRSFKFSPDGSHVIYDAADPQSDGRRGMFIVPSTGGTSIHLATTLCSTCSLSVAPALFTPDGSHVLNTTRLNSPDQRELYSFPSNGGNPIRLNAPLPAGQHVDTYFYMSPDGTRVIYTVEATREQFIVPTTGGTAVHFDLNPDGDFWTPDGSRVVYTKSGNVGPDLYSRVVRLRWRQGSGDWDLPANWDQGETPDEVMQVTIAGPSNITASGNTIQRTANELHVGGGAGISTLTLQSTAAITAVNGAFIELNGVLGGNGSIVGNLTNSGLVSPGASPGTLQINGNYVQSSSGTLQIELGSTVDFDKLLVTGNTSLDGTLAVSLLPGLTPAAGASFDILDSSGSSGTFATLQLPVLPSALTWDTSQLYRSGTISIAAVPEPSTNLLCLLGISTFALSGVARRLDRRSLIAARCPTRLLPLATERN